MVGCEVLIIMTTIMEDMAAVQEEVNSSAAAMVDAMVDAMVQEMVEEMEEMEVIATNRRVAVVDITTLLLLLLAAAEQGAIEKGEREAAK